MLEQEKRRYEDIDYFAYHDRNEVYDTLIHRYLPALRQRLHIAQCGYPTNQGHEES